MRFSRRDTLKAGAMLTAAAAVPSSMARADERIIRVATEEAWSFPEHQAALADLAKGPSDNLDLASLRLIDSRSWRQKALMDTDGERLERMDALGIDMQLLGLTAPGVQMFEPEAAVSMARLANDRLAEAIARHPKRYAGLASFTPQDPKAAVREMERAINELHLNGFIVNSHTFNEYLDLEKFWPILEAAEGLDMPIYIHPRAASDQMVAPFRDHNMHGAIWGFQVETGTHAMRMILSGLFDRFPRLQIVLGHMGESIPYNLWRADHQFNRRREQQKSSLLPSEVFARNFYITTSGVEHEPTLRYAVETLGVDRVMWAIDYPYQAMENSVKVMDGIAMAKSDKTKIYGGNAIRLFKIKA